MAEAVCGSYAIFSHIHEVLHPWPHVAFRVESIKPESKLKLKLRTLNNVQKNTPVVTITYIHQLHLSITYLSIYGSTALCWALAAVSVS
jgi:hypothetical protein